jgi:glyceraldehyde 3-phosphate dehydrogenase
MSTNVAINGLGRIGRAVLKQVLDSSNLKLVAVNDIAPAESLAYLLRYDSVYGRESRRIRAEDSTLYIEDHEIRVLNEKDPKDLPWGDLQVETVFECSGIFLKKEDLERHLQAGAKKVVLSAPPKSEGVPVVVPGTNKLDGNPRLRSVASCTTNCIAPVTEVIQRRIGIKKAIMTTAHAYTSSQELVDTPKKKARNGRAAGKNLVPSSTGAAKAMTLVLPELENRFDGVAIRCPVAVGSIADITFLTERKVTVEEVNQILKEESESSRYEGILGVTNDPIVSSDIIQDSRASLVDLEMTRVVGGDLLKVMSWYDNEWAYATQMIREVEEISKAA